MEMVGGSVGLDEKHVGDAVVVDVGDVVNVATV